jgi:mono/diheme cytochrome c family protein
MNHPLRALPLPGLALLVLALLAACADRPGREERAPAPGAARAELIASGAELYASYCASCHGASARGDGPAAASLDPPPSDLTTLAARWGRPLDRERLADFVDGRNAPRAHGPPGMPVWGERLYSGEREESPAREEARRGAILLILEYLQTLQQPEPPDGARPAPSASDPDTSADRRTAGSRAKPGLLRPGPGVRSAQDMVPAGERCVVEPGS